MTTSPSISHRPKAGLPVYLGSAAFYLGLVLITLAVWPPLVWLRTAPLKVRYRIGCRWARFNLWVLKHACGLDVEIRGLENIPATPGILACKHQSAFETIAWPVLFPPLAFVMAQEFLRIPVWGQAMASQEPIAIDQSRKSNALKQVINEGMAKLQEGRWVVIFPEGARVLPGQSVKYGGSVGLLASRAGCPVVPVAHNAGEFWTKQGFFKFPGKVQIRIGQPLDGNALATAEINQAVETWIEQEMREITGLGPYGRLPTAEVEEAAGNVASSAS